MGVALVVSFVLILISLLSLWATVLIIVNSVFVLMELIATMYLLNIKLSAITAVLLIASIGLGVCFTVHLTLVSQNRDPNVAT